jgi:hypothetical protein
MPATKENRDKKLKDANVVKKLKTEKIKYAIIFFWRQSYKRNFVLQKTKLVDVELPQIGFSSFSSSLSEVTQSQGILIFF